MSVMSQGHFDGFYAVGYSDAVSTLALQASANNGTTGGITCPACQAGDLLVFIEGSDGSGTVNDTYPSGFTPIVTTYDPSPNFTRRSASYKIATGSEGGTNIEGHTATTDRHVIMVFRGDVPITSVTVSSLGSEVTADNPVLQTVTPGLPPSIVIAGYASSAAISPRTFTPSPDAEITPATTFYVAYRINNAGATPVDVDMDDEGVGNSLMSWSMEVS